MSEIVVIGGGAAGCMAALAAAEGGAPVTLLERNPKLGRKLYITGKGRCNLTNHCPAGELLQNVPGNGRFLTSAVTRFPPAETEAFFEGLGVPLKVERGNRVFPASDRAADIIDALLRALRRAGVSIVQDRAVGLTVEEGHVTAVRGEKGNYPCKAAVIATGGASYPLTGSTGDGYDFARALGHTVVEPRPSLVPLVAEQDFCARMQGLSLRNVAIQVKNSKKKTVYAQQGELLFTHFGLSGPLILTASAHIRRGIGHEPVISRRARYVRKPFFVKCGGVKHIGHSFRNYLSVTRVRTFFSVRAIAQHSAMQVIEKSKPRRTIKPF